MTADPMWGHLLKRYTDADGGKDAKRWLADPVLWAKERLGAFLWSKQVEIAESVRDHRRTAVKSSHGVGKSWTAGMLACWWVDCHPAEDVIVVTTAPTFPQVNSILWREIRSQHARGGLAGRVLDGEPLWKVDTFEVGMGRKPSDYNEHAFQGIHRRYVLVVIDEACGVQPSLWVGAEAITTNADCRILAIGNPDDPGTEFGKVCSPGSGWNVLQISTFDSPNLTGEWVPDKLHHQLPTPEWAEDARKRWGTDSPLYQSKVLGEFPEVGADVLINPAWIVAAQNRELPPVGPHTLGVDVARFGSDRTVIYHRRGPQIRLLREMATSSTTETAGQVIAYQRELSYPPAQVDGNGVGGGVVDILAEQGAPVFDMQVGQSASDPVHFANARAEWFWQLRQRFEAGEVDLDPSDEELASQLGAIRYTYDHKGRIQIESKEQMKRRGMPSPDRADAAVLAFVDGSALPAQAIAANEFVEYDQQGYIYSPY